MVPETTPLLQLRLADIPPAPWSKALRSQREPARRVPQAIAHRGYKAAQPENTMAAFRAAVEVGAHAIETDLHLTRDGVVVLAHDGTLKRCYGVDKKINECDWEYLSTLRTLREPSQPLPRLSDLLEYLAEPGQEKIWVLLDIKMDDPASELLSRTAETIKAAPISGSIPWNLRIVFGCWTHEYINYCRTLLPSFPLAHIGVSIYYARQFLAQPNVSFNLLQKSLVGPLGSRFIRELRAAERPLLVWTVNDEQWMRWSLRKQVDGVITDDPKLFLDLSRRAEDGGGPESLLGTSLKHTTRMYIEALSMQLLIIVCMPFMLWVRPARWSSPKPVASRALHQ